MLISTTIRLPKNLHERLRLDAFNAQPRISMNKLLILRLRQATVLCATCDKEPPTNCVKCTAAAYTLGKEAGRAEQLTG